MDTTQPRESFYEWLRNRGFRDLPGNPHRTTLPNGEVVLHQPEGCTANVNERLRSREFFGDEDDPGICACLFAGKTGDDDTTTFLGYIGGLRDLQHALVLVATQDPYELKGCFPQIRNLALHHRWWYTERGHSGGRVLRPGSVIEKHPELVAVRDSIVNDWNAALAANPVDDDALIEEIIRYSTRHLMARYTLRATAGLHLTVMNAIQTLVSAWLSHPPVGSLLDEYYSERGETLRKRAVDVTTGSSFSLRTLEDIESEARRLLARNEMLACHVGSSDLKALELNEGPVPLIIWHGLRVRRNSVGFGEYPQTFCDYWAEVVRDQRRGRLSGYDFGATLEPICESPGLEPHQWEIAITLWDDSFANAGDDSGPYRDQRTAIRAAAKL